MFNRSFLLFNLVGCLVLSCIYVMAENRSAVELEQWVAPGEIEKFQAEIEDFFPVGPRLPGSEANLELEERVARRFAESGFEHGEMGFSAPHFMPGRTVVKVENEEFPLFPLHPSLFRPGNFKQDRFTTEIVYAGYGRTEDIESLHGKALRDRLILLEFNSGRNWQRFMRFDVKGFIFIEPENDNYSLRDAHDKIHISETAVPRFFIQRREAAAMRQLMEGGRSLEAEVEAEPSRWQNRRLRNLWVLIPGADESLSNETALFVAPLDANSVVPGLAEGAQNAANLNLMLSLLDEFSRQPPSRSVLLAAVNARTHKYLGDRILAWYLLQSQSSIEEIRNRLAGDIREQELLNSYYSRLEFAPEAHDQDEQFLIDLRTLTDHTTGRLITIKDPIVSLCQRDVNDIRSRQMALVREIERQELLLDEASAENAPESALAAKRRIEEIENQREELEEEMQRYINVLTLFNRVGIRTRLSDLDEYEKGILQNYVETLLAGTSESSKLNRRDLQTSIESARVREVMGTREISFAISLEMVWERPEIGFSSALPLGERIWANRWGRNTVRIAETIPEVIEGRRSNLLVDTLTQLGGLPEKHYVPYRSDTPIYYQSINGLPAFSLNNAYASHHRAFTPSDTFDRLDITIAADISAFTKNLIRRILSDPGITQPGELPVVPLLDARRRAWSCLIRAYKFDQFSAAVMPEVPVPNSALLLASTTAWVAHSSGFSGADIIDRYWSLTDQRGMALFYAINHESLSTAVFGYDDDFRTIDHVVDFGESHARINSNLTPSISRILSVIPTEHEITIGFPLDPSRVGFSGIGVGTFLTLSATRDSAPRAYGLTGASCGFSSKLPPAYQWGPVSFFVSPGDRLKLVTEQKRVALAIDDLYPEGQGFSITNPLNVDFFRQSVHDLGLLNEKRYRNFHGVTDGLVEGFLGRGGETGAMMEEAAAENRHLQYLQMLYQSLGAQTKGHGQISGITNDMLTAVVFFLALLLPFSFFLQKLLFNPVRIEAQMALFSVVFIVCFILFRLIHPAFRIAQAPEAMLVAFVMGGLALFVIYILHSRFEGEMKLLFSGLVGHDDTQIGYSMVGQQAMMIGVGNMKRRRIRTMLTTATIVLVTFTMLAFTSISRTMQPTLIPIEEGAPYTGLMYHWPGGSRMDEGTWQVLDEFFLDYRRVTRRWLLPETRQDQIASFRLETEGGGNALIEGVLGLSVEEDGFIESIPLIRGDYFSSDDAEEVVISASLADFMQLDSKDVGDVTLRFAGRSMTLVGIVDDERLRIIRDINRISILPIEEMVEMATEVIEDDVAGDAVVDAGGVFHMSPSRLLIMPVETSRRLGALPYSVSVRFDNNSSLWPEIDRLLISTNARFYIASREPFTIGEEGERVNQPGVYYVGAGYRTSIGGLAMLVIPLLIASTIILNTMLGSVFERKKEIAIFNAIGLNPTHIGTFFLAEAMVYGIIGSIGGYLVGQILSILLNYYGLVSDVNLNFSSLSVAYVIVFTVAIVLLSTLYPAIVATKAAVPSGKRKWAMPSHDGERMEVVFPFIYQPGLVPGVLNYLSEYFDQFTEHSTGDLIAEPVQKASYEKEGSSVYVLEYEIALPPFDLGVTQIATFEAAYDMDVGACRVTLILIRKSGQDSNWVTTNKPFLERLRKFLLNWRNLKPAEHDIHVQRGKELFGEEKNG